MRLQVSILLFDLFFSVSLSKVILTLMITCIVCLLNKRNFVVLLSKNFYILLQIINHNVKIGLTLSSNYLEVKVVLAADFLLCNILILETYIIFLELFQNTSYFLKILIVSTYLIWNQHSLPLLKTHTHKIKKHSMIQCQEQNWCSRHFLNDIW